MHAASGVLPSTKRQSSVAGGRQFDGVGYVDIVPRDESRLVGGLWCVSRLRSLLEVSMKARRKDLLVLSVWPLPWG